MRIVSSVEKKGRRYVNYGCAARNSKGPTACSNQRTVSELSITRDVFAEVKRLLKSPDMVTAFLKGYADQDAARRASSAGAAVEQLRKQLQEKQDRVDRLVEAVVSAGWSETLGKALRAGEEELAAIRGQLERLLELQKPKPMPSEKWLRARFEELHRLTEEAPRRGGEALRGWFGPVVVVPLEEDPEGPLEARGQISIDPASLSESGADSILTKTSCGGRI